MKDIKLEEVYVFWLDKTIKRIRQYTQQVFEQKGFKLTIDQWVILKRIADDEGCSQKEIAEKTYKDPASITRIIDALSKKGLVERRPQPTDRRRYDMYLTSEGNALYHQMIDSVIEIRKKPLENISESELQQLKSILDRMYDSFDELM